MQGCHRTWALGPTPALSVPIDPGDRSEGGRSFQGLLSRPSTHRLTAYGCETVVPSPVAEMLKVPAALLGAYE